MKNKILAFSLVLMMIFTVLMGEVKVRGATLDNFVMPVNFTPKQVIEHPTKPILYSIDSSAKKVYAINYNTMETSSIQLDLVPERIYFANNELYVALLKSGHNSYYEVPEEGAIAIVDLDNFSIKDQFSIDIDPYDFVVDKDSIIYVTSGSNQWTNLNSYSKVTKEKISSTQAPVHMDTLVVLHPTLNKIYSITTPLSPRDMTAFNISQGTFLNYGYDSPYHGDYDMDKLIKISPDGKYIFNSAGTIFKSTSNSETDMWYYKSLDSSFSDIDFDLVNNKIYTGIDKKIKIYDYTSLAPIKTFYASNTINSIFLKDNNIIAITKDANNKYYIEGLDKDGGPDNSLPLGVTYQTHVQNVGWQDWRQDGNLSGTEGKSYRLEGIKIKLTNASPDMKIKYQTHVQNVGWQNYIYDGQFSGTEGKSYRIEALRIQLENTPGYSIQYRVHVENIGWQDWAQNGELAGTEGRSLRIEAIQIRIVKDNLPSAPDTKDISIAYQGHVQNVGWQNWVRDGEISGTSGKGLRVEGLKLKLFNAPYGAKIKYQAHVQNVGWQDFSNELELAGTSGKSYRVEAIRILLENAPGYSVQYQTHVQNVGWQDWVQDGMIAGTEGESLRIEAIRIRIVKSGNSMWNIVNWGQVVQQDGNIYYSEPQEDGALYKSKEDGSEKIKLDSGNANFINIVDNWIYYSDYTEGGKIYKIKTDGTAKTKLNNVESMYTRVVGDKIYYVDPAKEHAVLTMNLDGSSIFTTNIFYGDYLYSSSKDFYFIDTEDDYAFYRYVLSTDSINEVSNYVGDYNITEDTIYFTGGHYTPYGRVGKISLVGGRPGSLSYTNSRFISVVGDWVYYSNLEDNGRLYRVRKDGIGRGLFSK